MAAPLLISNEEKKRAVPFLWTEGVRGFEVHRSLETERKIVTGRFCWTTTPLLSLLLLPRRLYRK
jgi:hypothetical protein